ncbi:MAG: hypothetical protein ACXWL5_00875 [Candidatus Chromulinivorax sp.]
MKLHTSYFLFLILCTTVQVAAKEKIIDKKYCKNSLFTSNHTLHIKNNTNYPISLAIKTVDCFKNEKNNCIKKETNHNVILEGKNNTPNPITKILSYTGRVYEITATNLKDSTQDHKKSLKFELVTPQNLTINKNLKKTMYKPQTISIDLSNFTKK